MSFVSWTPEGELAYHRGHSNEITVSEKAERKGEEGKYMSVYTWKHRQPSSVKGDPNRITRQARILPSIFKCYIGQVENFYLLICGVNTCGLGRRRREGSGGGGEEKREGRKRGQVTKKERGKQREKEKKIRPTTPRKKQRGA